MIGSRSAGDLAILVYTSGTTGPPKGALHAHRVLLGHIPGIQLPHDFFPQPGDRFWTPAEFSELAAHARAKGFLMVSASPLTRSSYHAGDDFARLRAARAAQLKT